MRPQKLPTATKTLHVWKKNIFQIWQNASYMLQEVYSYSIQIRAYMDKRMHEEAVKTALHFLNKLGETIPSNPTDACIKQEVCNVLAMKKVNTENVIVMPFMEDKTVLASMQVLVI